MIEAALKALIYFGVLKIFQPKELPEEQAPIDWWAGFAIMLAAVVLAALGMAGIRAAGLPEIVTLSAYLFFLVVPFIFFKFMIDYPLKEAVVYSVAALIVAAVFDFGFAFVVYSMSAS